MNIIQKALAQQNIDAAWQGPEPADSSEITSDYLTAEYEYGLPRMIRSNADTGGIVNIVQLRLDYENLSASIIEERRIAAIKAEANRIIESVIPDWKQRNAMARSIEIVNNSKGRAMTAEEEAEAQEINHVWNWIKLVRATSNAAENDGLQVYQVGWPPYS